MFSNSAQKPDLTEINHPLIYKGQESELPSGYNKDCLVAMPRDPYWLFCYWDFNEQTWQKLTDYQNNICTLRIRSKDTELLKVPVSLLAKSWYVHGNFAGLPLTIDLGIETQDGYLPFLTSNTVNMPPDSISQKTDELWLSIDELYLDEYYTKIGASPLFWQKEGKKKAQYMASPMPLKEAKQKEHLLVCDTDLIVYGKTTPGSVLLQNEQTVPIDTNGNFQMKLKLNEGLQNIELVSYAKNGLVKSKIITIKRG